MGAWQCDRSPVARSTLPILHGLVRTVRHLRLAVRRAVVRDVYNLPFEIFSNRKGQW